MEIKFTKLTILNPEELRFKANDWEDLIRNRTYMSLRPNVVMLRKELRELGVEFL